MEPTVLSKEINDLLTNLSHRQSWNITMKDPSIIQALAKVVWRQNETFGGILNGLQQEELFVENLDILDSAAIKVQALTGNEHSARKSPLGIATTMMYGRKHYLIQGRRWAPPLGKSNMGMYKTTPEPLHIEEYMMNKEADGLM